MTQVKIAIGAAAVVTTMAFAVGVTLGRSPAPAVALSAVTGVPQWSPISRSRVYRPFEQMWLDAGLAVKADRLARPASQPETIAAIPPAADANDLAQIAEEAKLAAKPKRTKVAVQYDGCRGKERTDVNNGKSRRCKR